MSAVVSRSPPSRTRSRELAAARAIALGLACLAASGCQRAKTGAAPATRTASVQDPDNGMEAATLELPAGWTFEGTVEHPSACGNVGAQVRYLAQDPGGASAVELQPGFAWTWSSDPSLTPGLVQSGCAVSPVVGAADALREMVLPRLRPGAQLVAIEPPPEALRAKLEARRQTMAEQTAHLAEQFKQAPPRFVVEGARARIRTSGGAGTVDELVSIVIDCTIYVSGTAARTAEKHQCSAASVELVRAATDELEARRPELERVQGSLRINPAWTARMQGIP